MDSFAWFVEGPLLWAAFVIFIVGSVYHVVAFFILARKRDKVIYQHFRWKYVLLSWVRFILPFNQTVAKSPFYTTLSYVFHVLLVIIPLFLVAHIMAWEESYWGWSWYTLALPDAWFPYLTIVVIGVGVAFIIRRIALPEVRVT